MRPGIKKVDSGSFFSTKSIFQGMIWLFDEYWKQIKHISNLLYCLYSLPHHLLTAQSGTGNLLCLTLTYTSKIVI